MKIARKHIILAIEMALDLSSPVEKEYAKYVVYASPYKQVGVKGNGGVRVTWRKK